MENRDRWREVDVLERVMALLVFAAGVGVMIAGVWWGSSHILEIAGAAMCGIALYPLLPSTRPWLKWLSSRVPFLRRNGST